jgi:putative NADH-flavin reductase
MKVVVFGASKGVGRCLVEQCLAQGHHVTAAARHPQALGISHERLRLQPCDVLDAAAVGQAMAGQEVVFGTLGASSKGPITLYSAGARNIVRAMQAHGVRRLVFLSNFGVLDETAQGLRSAALLFLVKRMIRPTLADHRRALTEIAGRVPEWVAVRPMALTNGPRTGRYRIAIDDLPANGTHIARADVADFMLAQATGDAHLSQVPAIAY